MPFARHRNRIIGFGLALALSLVSAAVVAAVVDPPPTFKASALFPPTLLKTENYTVDETVTNNGIMNHYTLTTPYGTMTADSTDRLFVRFREAKALAAMEKTKQSDVFVAALKKGAEGVVDTAKNLVDDPGKTLSDMASGVGDFFSDVGHSITGGKSEEEAGTAETVIGYDVVKRQFAYKFGVDPYTTNPLVRKRLTELSRAAVAGGLSMKVAFAAIPGNVGLAVSATSTAGGMAQLVRDKSPAELKEINDAKLKEMGVDAALRQKFLEHPKYSPTKKTFLVGYLETLDNVRNRAAFIERATLAKDEPTAFYNVQHAAALAGYHANVRPIVELVDLNGLVFARDKAGTLAGVFPVDYLIWKDSTAGNVEKISAAAADLPSVDKKALWLSGTGSPMFRDNIEAAGWTVTAEARDRLQPR